MEGSTTLGQEYSMNLIKDATIQESDGNNFPVYIDSSQNAYDKYYNKIEKLNVNSDKFYTDAITHQKVPAVYNINDETDLEFPNPENYFSKEDYSNAVDKWYDRARSHYSTLRLPFPVSGQFYLPQMPKIWSKEEAKLPLSGRFKTFKVDTWNLLPTNYNEMVKLLFLKQPIDPEGQFPEQVPHRPAILYKHHISSESQWQSQMIPQEPEAITFDSFEEYEQTFVRWASLASSFIHNPLIPPNQFENIASLDIIPKEEKVPLKSPLLQFEPVNLDEWKKAPISSDFKKSFDNIKKRKSHHSRHTKTRRSSRVKVEKVNPFIEEFSQYGYILEHINSSAPICMPLNNIKIKIERSVKIDFEQENDVNDEFIRTFLQFSYSLEQIVESMKQKMGNGLTFMENFEKYISDTSKIKYILGMRNYVEQKYERRVSLLFRGFIASYHETKLFYTFISQHGSTTLFYDFVKCLLSTIRSDFVLYRAENESTFGQQINFYYLLNIFNDLIVKCQNANLSFDVVQILHTLTFDILRQLKDEKLLNTIRKKETTMLLMLLQCDSLQIHQIILGTNYIKWINKISKQNPIVVQTIIHGNALVTASKIFLEYCISLMKPKILKDATLSTYYLLVSINHYIIKRCKRLKLPIDAKELLKVLELTALNENKNVVSTSESIASILTLTDFIKDYKESTFQTLLVKTVAAVCQGLKAEDSIIYHEQIKALEQLSKDKTCCLTMSQIKPFMESVASHFLDSNPNISQKSWNFFLQLTSNHNVLLDAIKIPNVKTIMTSIANKDHITSLKNLLSFSIEIFQSKDGNELKKQIIEILLPSIGKLVTMYKMRNSIYKNNTQMKDLLQEFITTARKLKKDEFSEFQNALSKHLGDEKSSRSLIKTFTK